LVQAGGDMQIEGRIVGYEVIPVAPQGGSQVATIQRLQIKMEVTYYNAIEEDQSFDDKVYTQFEDFEQNQTLSQVEEQLVEIILDRIVFDIFNDTAGNW
jgi:predicted glycosyltransferase